MFKLIFPHFFKGSFDSLIAIRNKINPSCLLMLQIGERFSRNSGYLQIFLIALIEMFSKFYLIFLLQLNIVFDEVIGPVSGFFAHLFVSFVEFGLVEQGHLDHLLVVDHFFVLV